MSESKRIILIKGLLIFVFFIVLTVEAADPLKPSQVYVKGNQLFVASHGQAEPQPYIIKGITWSPETAAPDFGPDPLNPSENVEYGFFFDWDKRQPQGHEIFVLWKEKQFFKRYATDIPLMKKMNLNTVRVYSSFGLNPKEYLAILDEFYHQGLSVIMTVAISKSDIDLGKHKRVVQAYKDHPAILFWSIGNEWNLDYNKYWGYATVEEAAQATNRAAKAIKAIDSNHPVGSVLGDRFQDQEPKNTIKHILKVCPDVDLWGLNIYRDKSFGNLFSQWQSLTDKPFYICEFGTDSFFTESYDVVGGYQADNCKGREDQAMQAEFALGLWGEISGQLSAKFPQKQCLGGLVHEFNDSLWKVGSYHVSLGGLVDYNSPERCSYKEYDSEGFYLPGGHPDDVANEEYFGVVDANRQPKQAFFKLQEYYRQLE